MEGLIQSQNEQILLTYLLYISTTEEASFATKAQVLQAIDHIKQLVNAKLKKASSEAEKGNLLLTLERIKSPEKAKPTLHVSMPPGSPIGCDVEDN